MNCLNCNADNDNNALYCNQCGHPLTLVENENIDRKRRDVLLLASYVGWHFIYFIIYILVNKLIVPDIMKNSGSGDFGEKIDSLFKKIDLVTSSIDALFLLILVFLLENKIAKILCGVYLIVRVGLYVFTRVS